MIGLVTCEIDKHSGCKVNKVLNALNVFFSGSGLTCSGFPVATLCNKQVS